VQVNKDSKSTPTYCLEEAKKAVSLLDRPNMTDVSIVTSSQTQKDLIIAVAKKQGKDEIHVCTVDQFRACMPSTCTIWSTLGVQEENVKQVLEMGTTEKVIMI
jgi:hypothetical protein